MEQIKKKSDKNLVAFSSVLAAIFLTGSKLLIGLFTGSLGILSEALHSGFDLIAAIMTMFAVKMSDLPPDEDHNFGHGKIENLSALVETLLLLLTCVWIIYEAIDRLRTGTTHIEVTAWSFGVIIVSVIIDYSRSRALMKAAKEHNSQALEADALHFSTDIWSSGVVLLGLICSYFGFYWADAIAALGVAIIVIGVCYSLGKRTIDALLDKSPLKLDGIIDEIKNDFPEIITVHDIRTRPSGPDIFIELNIHVFAHLTIEEAHAIAHKFEDRIKAQIERSNVHIHIEPNEE